SRGRWAPSATIAAVRRDLAAERATPAHSRRRTAAADRRARIQEEYVAEFAESVFSFLDFSPSFNDLARALADAVTRHAAPVGSGTVARTRRIPVARRA